MSNSESHANAGRLPPINVKDSDRKRYYEAFDTYYRDNKTDTILNLISEQLNEQIRKYTSIFQFITIT